MKCACDVDTPPPLCEAHKRRRRADIVRLNVGREQGEGGERPRRERRSIGGRHFDCLRDTLRGLGYFDLYLSGRIGHAMEPF